VTCSSAEAQQATKIHRTGYLSGSSPSTSANRREAFQQGLHELGYVEGKNIVSEWRWAHGKFDRLPALAAELVRLKGRCNRYEYSGTHSLCQDSNPYDPHRDGT
ncbi:MAG: hypothetical protein ACTHLX_22655, partial [Candidatus Binatia bacterium]